MSAPAESAVPVQVVGGVTAISDAIAVVACLPGPAFVAAALAATAELNAMRELLSAARAWEQSGGDVDKTHALRAALARCS